MDQKDQLASMTVNERLFALGLLDEFDAAMRCRDKVAVTAILLKSHLTDVQAQQTTQALFADPGKYGFG